MTRGHPLLAIALASAFVAACGAAPPKLAPAAARPSADVRELPARPPLAVVVRDGDPRAALAVAVVTAGVADDEGARVPVALSAVTESRLAAAGVRDFTVVPTWDGYRVRALVPQDGDSTLLVRALREALVSPIAAGGPEAAAVARKLLALAGRPLEDPALENAARCEGGPRAEGHEGVPPPSIATLEQWRAASQGLGRIVFGAVGTAHDVDGIASVLLAQPAWPLAGTRAPRSPAHPAAPRRVYDASADVAPGSARVTVVVHTPDPSASALAATALGATRSPLALRLHSLDATARLHDVTATAHVGGGCLALTLEVAHTESDPNDTIAMAAAIGEQEARLSLDLARLQSPPARTATLAGSALDAADLAAWWAALGATTSVDATPMSSEVVVGIGAAEGSSADFATRARVLEGEIERTETALQTKTVDARTSVEHGQGAIWMLVGSPCGVLAEGEADAGLTALAVAALAEEARRAPAEQDVTVEGWITSDGVGLIVRAAGRGGESAGQLAKRAADVAGSAFMAGDVHPDAIARARAGLMNASARDDDTRSFATLASALTPGHPSWSFPLASGRGLEAWSDGAVAARIAAIRHGPIRAAVLASEDAAQASTAVDALDRWLAHPPGETHACPASAAPPTPHAGTYAAPPSSTPSAWLALALTRGPASPGARDAALVTAAALDGPDGLLAHALSSGLASSWSAKVIGPSEASSLVVHVGAGGHTLDAAVAQVRALLDHLRQGAFTEESRTRAESKLASEQLRATLEPEGRLVRLWRGDPKAPAVPSLDALHAFHAETLHDDALVIVASRPPLAKVIP